MYRKDEKGKLITCAVVLIDKDGNILGCHAGKDPEKGFDFPKGCADEGETDLEAAKRELQEETGIYLDDDEHIIDCGIHPHNTKKVIHLFLYKVSAFPDLQYLRCTTFFKAFGKEYPEVNGYEVISKENRHKFNQVLQNKFEIIDKHNC